MWWGREYKGYMLQVLVSLMPSFSCEAFFLHFFLCLLPRNLATYKSDAQTAAITREVRKKGGEK